MPCAEATFLKLHFKGVVLPAYRKQYPATTNLPDELMIDEGNLDIDGFGSPGLVGVSEGVAKEKSYSMRLFALAHETGHAVTPDEFQSIGVNAYQPIGPDAKRFEHMADIIGMRMLKAQMPSQAAAVMSELGYLTKWLGNGDAMHPTGKERADLIARCYQGNSFSALFTALANRQVP